MKDKYKSGYAKKRAANKRKSAPKPAGRKQNRKTTKVSKRGLVVPTKVHTSPGVLSQSSWLAANKLTPRVKAIEMVGTRNIYTNNDSDIFTCSPGHWACFTFPHLQKTDYQGICTVLPPAGTRVNAPKRFVSDSYLSDQSFTNTNNVSTEMELYDVVCRKDLPFINTFTIGTQAYTVSPDPVAYITEGIAACQGAPTLSVGRTALLIGTSPYDSPFFKEYFKVVKRTVVQLAPGASHRHTVSLKPSRLCTEE